MIDLLSREKVGAFYELIGEEILSIESRGISESEKERLYLIADRDLRMYEDILKNALMLKSGLGRLFEGMRNAGLSLEEARYFLGEFTRGTENLEVDVEIFGLRAVYSERVWDVSRR